MIDRMITIAMAIAMTMMEMIDCETKILIVLMTTTTTAITTQQIPLYDLETQPKINR